MSWSTLKERKLIIKARLVYKITYLQAPVALTEIIDNSLAPQQTHKLRNNECNFCLPKLNIEYISVWFCETKL